MGKKRNSKIDTAYHEAGHAVGAYFHRRAGSPERVVLDQTGDERLEDSHRAGFFVPAKTIPPVVAGRVDHAAIRDSLIMILAGPEAQRHYTNGRRVGEGGDLEHARSRLVSTIGSEIAALVDEEFRAAERRVMERIHARLNERIEAYRAQAAAFVVERCECIEAVAGALMLRGRLTGDEVTKIIETVERRESRT